MGHAMNTTGTRLGWRLSQVADAIGGRLVGDGEATIDRVSTDSREDMSGALFVAIAGERFDGHRFAADALAAGAVGVVVGVGGTAGDVVPRIEVGDTIEALLRLGSLRRSELTIPVVAITGSTGKTSTKDLIASGLEGSWASRRSYNNEIGVPLTVLSTPDAATTLVLEVGSRGRGHIRWLGPTVRPDVAVVTNLGVVHLETFGSQAGLADAKFELVEMLGPDGIAVLPADEPRLHRGSGVTTITFGFGRGDVSVEDLSLDARGYPTFTIRHPGGEHRVTLSVAGAHQALNAAAAVGVATALGIDLDRFVEGMSTAAGSAWRMDVHEGAFTVVNDAYNANPQSIAGALRTVAAMRGAAKIAVLGPMAELGHVCEEQHEAMGALARQLGFASLIVIGPDHGYVLGAGDLVVNATDLAEAADTLHAIVEPGDVVLIKASRSAGLERLALDLIEADPTAVDSTGGSQP
jgi:UDP-N-acetylmuramoyl-tripeptide--D-alanyl-D-alanine ligase